jgi:hypothetical protein
MVKSVTCRDQKQQQQRGTVSSGAGDGANLTLEQFFLATSIIDVVAQSVTCEREGSSSSTAARYSTLHIAQVPLHVAQTERTHLANKTVVDGRPLAVTAARRGSLHVAHVCRLEVAVHNAAAVKVGHALSNIQKAGDLALLQAAAAAAGKGQQKL